MGRIFALSNRKKVDMSKEMSEWISASAEVAMLIDELDLEFIEAEE